MPGGRLEWSTFGQLPCKKRINESAWHKIVNNDLSNNTEQHKTTQIHDAEICNQQVAGSIPVASSKQKPPFLRCKMQGRRLSFSGLIGRFWLEWSTFGQLFA